MKSSRLLRALAAFALIGLLLPACSSKEDEDGGSIFYYVLVSILSQSYNGSSWDDSDRDSHSYDGSGRLVSTLEENWTGSAWVNDDRTSYTYDGQNRVVEMLEEQWNGSTWVNYRKTLYTFAAGRLTQELEQSWTGSAWQDEERWDYSYDGSGKLTQGDGYDYTGGINPNLEDRWTFTYDSNGRVLSEIHEHDSGGGMQNVTRYQYVYVAGTGRIDYQTYESWSVGSWSEALRSRFNYNAGGRIQSLEISGDGGGSWSYRGDLAYDGSGRLVTETFSVWNSGTSAWDPNSRDQHGYGSATGRILPDHSGNNPLRYLLFKIYGEEINRYLGM